MVLAVGWGERVRDLGEGPVGTCTNCSNVSGFRVIETSRKATVMFVPVAKWSTEYWVACPICERAAPLASREEAQQLVAESMKANGALLGALERGESDTEV